MWFVYILKSTKAEKFYTGCTNNLQRRLHEHNKGNTVSIKKFIPYKIIYTEEFLNKEQAYLREKEIKSFKGGNAFKILIIK